MNNIREKILWWAFKRRIAKDKPIIIAITGTIAKSSTKNVLGQILKSAYGNDVRVGYGNLNSYLGVPLAGLGFEIDFYKKNITWQWGFVLIEAKIRSLFTKLPKYLILEFGVDKPDDMKMLTGQIKPNIAVITAIDRAHIGNFVSREQYVEEKLELIKSVKVGGKIYAWRKDENIEAIKSASAGQLNLIDCEVGDIAKEFAKKISEDLGVKGETINRAMSEGIGIESRMSIVNLPDCTLIDDSYNANPLSMKAALAKLAEQPGRRVAILGDMLELGEKGDEWHKEIGQIARKNADFVIGVGHFAKNYNGDVWFEDSKEASQKIVEYMEKGDSILVKGSHSMKMNLIVEAIKNK